MDFRLPELGEGVYEAELVAWLVKPGDLVKRGQPLMEVMTDKATMEVPAPFAGSITSLHAEPGASIKVGDVVLTFDGGAQTTDGPPAKMPAVADQVETPETSHAHVNGGQEASPAARLGRFLSVKAAPSVRAMARSLGIDLGQVPGSGPGGRILIDDLSRHVKSSERPDRQSAAAPPRQDYGTPGTRIKMAGLRRRIAEHMVQSKRTIPHYSYVDECDLTALVSLRATLRERYEQAGIRLTYPAFFIKAVVAALKEVPIVNASLDDQAGEILVHDQYHIGLAVATPNGLVVPVVRDADRKDLAQIAREVQRLSTAARTGKVQREELRGSTFTITSIGGIGGLFSTPVINHPEVAILGVGKIVKRPVFDGASTVRAADMAYLSFSFDHRVVDGAVGAAFANAIIGQLQNPALLLLPDKLL